MSVPVPPDRGQLRRSSPDARRLHAEVAVADFDAPATVLSRRVDDGLRLAGFEMLKAFPGIETHETEVVVPVVDNAQDMRALAQVVAPRLEERLLPGYLIRGHGLYAWGADLDAATRHVEAFEFLFACALEELRLDAGKERSA